MVPGEQTKSASVLDLPRVFRQSKPPKGPESVVPNHTTKYTSDHAGGGDIRRAYRAVPSRCPATFPPVRACFASSSLLALTSFRRHFHLSSTNLIFVPQLIPTLDAIGKSLLSLELTYAPAYLTPHGDASSEILQCINNSCPKLIELHTEAST